MSVDIEWAKNNDDVGKDFEDNYVPTVKKKDYVKAKLLMSELLAKYGGKEDLMKNEYDYSRYKKASYLVYSYSKDEMEKALREGSELIQRKNRLSKFFDDHQHLIFDLPDFARDSIITYNNRGLLRGLENLELLYQRCDNPKEKFNELGNELYNVLQMMGEKAPVCFVLGKSNCGRDWIFCGSIGYVS